MAAFLFETARIFAESATYLLFGFAASGLVHVALSRFPNITRSLTGKGAKPVVLASLIGMPMPLCSCSVLPAALAIRREGASRGATASFLVSVPETDIVSIMLTYALLGPVMAIYRPIAALVTALTTGLVVSRLDRDDAPPPVEAAQHTCCKDPASSEKEEKVKKSPANWIVRALRYGFVDMMDDIIVRLILGMVLAGALMAWLPALGLERVSGGSVLTYLAMLAIGVPLYVCATASTPVAVGLIAGGVSPGAALVFLLAGPATNIASLFVLSRHLGRAGLVGYLASIGVVSVVMGMLLDQVLGTSFLSHLHATEVHEHGSFSLLNSVSAAILLVMTLVSAYRTRVLNRALATVRRWFGASAQSTPDEG